MESNLQVLMQVLFLILAIVGLGVGGLWVAEAARREVWHLALFRLSFVAALVSISSLFFM